MGINNSSKIKQTNIGKRLQFKDVFKYIHLNSLKGYLALINLDIFFDSTIENLKLSTLHNNKHMFALLRYEYNGEDTNTSLKYGKYPQFDSQDTWIFHSNNMIKKNEEKIFDFEFGIPGCDNKMVYLMKILGYKVINDPNFIKTYHYHQSQIRNYTNLDRIEPPYGLTIPAGTTSPDNISLLLKKRIKEKMSFEDNDILREYIKGKIVNNTPFISELASIIW
jgi:hypothetical protein